MTWNEWYEAGCPNMKNKKKELEVKPCANGKRCEVVYDESDGTLVIFKDGMALGYVVLDEIFK